MNWDEAKKIIADAQVRMCPKCGGTGAYGSEQWLDWYKAHREANYIDLATTEGMLFLKENPQPIEKLVSHVCLVCRGKGEVGDPALVWDDMPSILGAIVAQIELNVNLPRL